MKSMEKKNALALGTFDGLHRGHLAVLTVPEEFSRVALTFAIPPKFSQDGKQNLIMSVQDKLDGIKRLGFCPVCLSFEEVKNIPAETFLDHIARQYEPAYISCGFNYRFGKDGRGDTALLRDFCQKQHIVLQVAEPVLSDGSAISSTDIRQLLAGGSVEKANRLMLQNFSFEQTVISGDRRGRTLGFPTANQKYPPELTPLQKGVYETRVHLGQKTFRGITDIGSRPTYPLDYIISETHILHYSGELYGKQMRTEFIRFIRPERKFNSAEELQAQIRADLESLKE